MNLILFDDNRRKHFLPLAFTNSLAELLIGMFTNRERWEKTLGTSSSSLCPAYLSSKFPTERGEDNILINSRALPDSEFVDAIRSLPMNSRLTGDKDILAMRLDSEELKKILESKPEDDFLACDELLSGSKCSDESYDKDVLWFSELWDFYKLNNEVFERDLALLDKSKFVSAAPDGNQIIGENVIIHSSAKVSSSVFNSSTGPIVIDEGAEVMEGCLIRGPFYLGKNSSLKMGAKIYGASSIGISCKVGGEVNNSIINSYSNKAHDGFIGNSIIGQWCNLGADSNTSNLKNDYSIVKLWNYEKNSFVRSGQQFLGLVMGDHSKCGINTMFNTGTVVGVSCNVYGSGFQPNFIPSFSWGRPSSFNTYQIEKAMQVAEKVMERRGKDLDEVEKALLLAIFEFSEYLRVKFHKPS